ncbi:MAG: Gfo/Idh/MocA family oxidoreductase [Chloroflexota bacterium]
MPIGWGIIGIGAHVRQRIVPALKKAADTELVAVCSRSLERAREFAREQETPHAYDSLAGLLADPAVDVLYVASPNSLHAEQTIQAAEAGKHVLCEKPMALTVEDCRRMMDACRNAGVKLGVDFQNRYHPAHVEARRLIQAGEVGEITLARAQYCPPARQGRVQGWKTDPKVAGAGALMGNGLHAIDLLRFLLDSEVTEVVARRDPEAADRVEKMVYVMLKFANGVRGIVVAGGQVPRSDNDAVLYGTKAKITCQGTVGMPLLGELCVEGEGFNLKMDFPVEDPVSGNYLRVVEAFNRCVRENTGPDIPGEIGLQMAVITDAVLESSRSGQVVELPPK